MSEDGSNPRRVEFNPDRFQAPIFQRRGALSNEAVVAKSSTSQLPPPPANGTYLLGSVNGQWAFIPTRACERVSNGDES